MADEDQRAADAPSLRLNHLAEACVCGATATNRLQSWLIPMAGARKRRDAHGRTDETGPGRGCATAPSSSLGVRMYFVPESQAVRCLHIIGTLGRAVLAAQMHFYSAVVAAH